VALPLTLTGGKASDDPEIQALHDELHDLNQRLRSHVVRFRHMCSGFPREVERGRRARSSRCVLPGQKSASLVPTKACARAHNPSSRPTTVCFTRRTDRGWYPGGNRASSNLSCSAGA